LRGLYYAVQQARIGDSLSSDPFAFDQNGLAAPEVQALRFSSGLIPVGVLVFCHAHTLSTVQVTCGAGGRRLASLAAGGVLIIAIMLWGHGLQALYGWPAEKAVGSISHELLATEFPVPLPAIEAELLETGLWQGRSHVMVPFSISSGSIWATRGRSSG
jgi:hypothetical protein